MSPCHQWRQSGIAGHSARKLVAEEHATCAEWRTRRAGRKPIANHPAGVSWSPEAAMKKRQKARTITLNQETIRVLTDREIKQVVGGTDESNGDTVCRGSWCGCTRYPA